MSHPRGDPKNRGENGLHDAGNGHTYVRGLVEPELLVKRGNGRNLLLSEIEGGAVEVESHDRGAGRLGNDSEAALRGPAEENLGGLLAVLLGEGSDGGVLHERREADGLLHAEDVEAGRAERRVGRHGDALVLGEPDKVLLDEVGVVLDLESGRGDLGIAEEIIKELSLEVGDTDVLGETLGDEALHGAPRLLDRSVGADDLRLAVDVPAGRVADAGVNVLESDGEVHNVEVEVVDAPVGELLLGDGLHTLGIVERVPQLGDEEELLTLHEAILDGTGDTLAALNLVAVVCK